MIIAFLSHTNDGTMTVSIDGQKYIYFLDAIWIHKIRGLAKYQPAGGLTLLKKKARDYRRINDDDAGL